MDEIIKAIAVAIIGGIFQVIIKWIELTFFPKESGEPPPRSFRQFIRRLKSSLQRRKKLIFSRRTMYWMLALGIVTFAVLFVYNRISIKAFISTHEDPCPNRQNVTASNTQEVEVRNGYVAYFMGWKFDEIDGGYFIRFNGPYKGTHDFSNGVYCPSIPTGTELSQKTVDMLMLECQKSPGGCSTTKTCSQSIFEYYFGGGKCHEE